MIIGKTFKFEAAHWLPGHNKCGKMHGHTYKLTVEVEGEMSSRSGMVMDLHTLSDMVSNVIKNFDHSSLNEYFTSPTCEKIAEAIANGMEEQIVMGDYLPDLRLHSVTLQEGEGGYARVER